MVIPPMEKIPEGASAETRQRMHADYVMRLRTLNPYAFNPDGSTKTVWGPLLTALGVTLVLMMILLVTLPTAKADSFTFSYSDTPGMFHVYRPNGAYPPWYNRGPRVNITINGGSMYSKYYRGGGERFPRPFKPHYERRKTHTPHQYWGPPKGGWTVTVR